MFAEDDLPDHFEDAELLAPLNPDTAVETADRKRYNPSLGMLNKLRSGLKRLIKRQHIYLNTPPYHYTESSALFLLWEALSKESAIDLGWGDQEMLHQAAEVVALKYLTIWTGLYKNMNMHPLLPPAEGGVLRFYQCLVDAVLAYQASIERPEGTFEDNESKALAATALEYPRETCSACKRRRQIYCGSCGGLRMPEASVLLPPRFGLPFDILLLVHWHETLHKCTGVHTAVLSTEGTVEHFNWTKEEITTTRYPEMPTCPMWGPLVLSLDPARDIVLFPSKDSISASDFEWTTPPSAAPSDDSTDGRSSRYRLVVLEATWNHAKGMIRSISTYRSMHGLPALRCVRLDNVVGQYWRFHEEGNSALSTIEAITYTASCAGLGEEDCHKLLTLFRVQKGRVLLRMEHGKKPRAVCVSGTGDGDWKNVSIAPLPEQKGGPQDGDIGGNNTSVVV